MAIVRKIKIVPYDHQWPERFYEMSANLKSVLKEIVYDVHHIGSTAVHHMYARPIIDALLAVRDFDLFDAHKKQLLKNGYKICAECDGNDKKIFYRMVQGGTVKENIYVYRSHDEIERHVRFCQYLQRAEEDARHFSRLKQVLINEDPFDIKKYTEKKLFFIQMLEKKIEAERAMHADQQ